MEFKLSKSSTGSNQIFFGDHRTNEEFYQLARRIERILSIKFTHKSDDFNTLRWQYAYEGVPLVLMHHWDSGTVIQVDKLKPSSEEESTLQAIMSTLETY